jgi:hypothetical protein
MTHFSRSSLLALCAASVCTLASAKLPAPSPEAAAKAAEAAAKAAWAGKVDNYKLCLSQDRVAAHYRNTETIGQASRCGGFGLHRSRPLCLHAPSGQAAEAAGAHSPPGTASSPPSTLVPAAAAASAPKS